MTRHSPDYRHYPPEVFSNLSGVDTPGLIRPQNPTGRALRTMRAGRVSPPGATGRMLNAQLGSAGILRDAGGATPTLVPPRGLFLGLEGAGAARCRLTVGTPDGGVEAERVFTLTRVGAWLTCSAWDSVILDVLAVGAEDVTVSYAWLTQEAPADAAGRLLLVESLLAGSYPVPDGAYRVTASLDDAGFVFTTNPDGTTLTQNAPLSAGVARDITGDFFTSVVQNVYTWELWAP